MVRRTAQKIVIFFLLCLVAGCAGRELIYTPSTPPARPQSCNYGEFSPDNICLEKCGEVVVVGMNSMEQYRKAIDCKDRNIEAWKSYSLEWEAFYGIEQDE